MDAPTINATTDLVALVPGLRQRGRYFSGPCPFCGGVDRFTIKRAEDGDLWICRKCGDGKYHDAVAFRMRAEGRSFKEVTSDERRVTSSEQGAGSKWQVASGRWQVPLPPGEVRRGSAAGGSRPSRSELVSRISDFVSPPDEAWQIRRLVTQKENADRLWAAPDEMGEKVWHYLRAWRGLEPDTIRAYMLGFNPDWRLLDEGIRCPPGIHIPCMVGGQLWYVKVRLPKQVRTSVTRQNRPFPKYMVFKGSRAALFNADKLAGARVAVVVEGEFDALLLGQFLPPGWAAVTMGGTANLPGPAFVPCFLHLERVLLRLDADAAGENALADWRRLLPRAEPLPPLPGGAKDITDYWRAGGDLRAWLGV
jgi:hypothetical protein